MVEKKDKEEKKKEAKAAEELAQEQATEVSEPEASAAEESPGKAAPASFDDIEHSGAPTNVNDNIERILDIPITVAVEVGRVRMLINDLLQLGHGSVIELDKTAGEPMEILVNDRLVAKGEVVAVNEKFGIRLTDIISPTERIKQLRK